MSDDRTRVMGRGAAGAGGPDDGRRHLRYLIGGLLAVIVGLVIAIVVIAGNEGSQENTGVTDQIQPVAPVAPEPEDSSGGVSPDQGESPADQPDGSGESGGSSGDSSGGVSPNQPPAPQPSPDGQSGGIGP